MDPQAQPHNLEELLGHIRHAQPDGEGNVSLGSILATLGPRAFAPWVLLAGIIAISPIGDIPGAPTLVGMLVLLISLQLLFGRRTFWVPQWLLRRSVSHARLCKSIRWMEKPSRGIDRLLRPRLPWFTHGFGARLVAATTVLIALGMPVMELVPFSVTGAALALMALSLGLIAQDGLFVLIAFVVASATIAVIAWQLIGG